MQIPQQKQQQNEQQQQQDQQQSIKLRCLTFMHILQNSKFQRRRKRVKLKENHIRNLGESKNNSTKSLSIKKATRTTKVNTLQLWQRSLAIKNQHSHLLILIHIHTRIQPYTCTLSQIENLTKYLQPTGPILFLSITKKL